MARRSSTRLRVRFRLTSPAWALLAIGGLSLAMWIVSKAQLQLAVGAAMWAAVAIDAVIAYRTIRPIAIDIRCPDEVTVGEASTWTAQVDGLTRPITVTPLLTPTATDLLVGHARVGTLSWPALNRGIVPFAIVDTKATGPLGMAEAGRRHHVTLPTPVHVTPRPIEVPMRWPRARAIGFGMTEGSPIGDDLFRTVRPYRFGDERRRVHWKATAHHGELMVRESDGMGVVLVRVIVDLGMPGSGAEFAAGRAAYVATAALDRGWAVELVTLDASAEIPQLADMGNVFAASPKLQPPPLVPLPTVAAPVRNAKDVRHRLSSAACGTPVVPGSGGGWRGLTCWVTRDGVVWS